MPGFEFHWPTPAYLFGAIVFGLVGFAAFRYGRAHEAPRPLWVGLALMAYPYLVPSTTLLYLIGAALCALLLIGRR